MGLPHGTVTFLFTDLEGSTSRWEAHPVEMRQALARHDVIVRGAVESHGGTVFATMGDGMAAVFSSAREAVRAVLAAKQALGAEDWGEVTGPLAARMGLWTDEGVPSGEGYLNQPLNRCARLMGMAGRCWSQARRSCWSAMTCRRGAGWWIWGSTGCGGGAGRCGSFS
jgi:class 3 adenylate cyclase